MDFVTYSLALPGTWELCRRREKRKRNRSDQDLNLGLRIGHYPTRLEVKGQRPLSPLRGTSVYPLTTTCYHCTTQAFCMWNFIFVLIFEKPESLFHVPAVVLRVGGLSKAWMDHKLRSRSTTGEKQRWCWIRTLRFIWFFIFAYSFRSPGVCGWNDMMIIS